jgi:hypothetical protein
MGREKSKNMFVDGRIILNWIISRIFVSVSIVSGYRLDDLAIEVRSLEGAKYFSSSLCVQTASETHPASCKMSAGDPFPGLKLGGGVTLTTHPHLVPRSRMSRSCTSSPSGAYVVCSRQL